jgi:hypothetical protein
LESRTEARSDGETHPELSQKRRDFEARIGDLRGAFDRDFGWAPRSARWVLPTMAAAAGFGAALWLRSIAAGERGPRREVKA